MQAYRDYIGGHKLGFQFKTRRSFLIHERYSSDPVLVDLPKYENGAKKVWRGNQKWSKNRYWSCD